jgi:hypothetical protein
VKAGVNDGFESVLLGWYQQKSADNILNDEPMLHAKTKEIAAQMVISGFKASLQVAWCT